MLFHIVTVWCMLQHIKCEDVNRKDVLLGDNVTLSCKGDTNGIGIDWLGPAHDDSQATTKYIDTDGQHLTFNVSKYSDKDMVNPELPHNDRLKILNETQTRKYDLQIINVSSFDEGLYICDRPDKNDSQQYILWITDFNHSTIATEQNTTLIAGSTGHKLFHTTEYSIVIDEVSDQPTALESMIVTICVTVVVVICVVVVKLAWIRYKYNVQEQNSEHSQELQPIEGQSESVENILYQTVNETTVSTGQNHVVQSDDTSSDNTVTDVGVMSDSNMEHGNEAGALLNYADVVFPSSSTNEQQVNIRGIENRTTYADVDLSKRVSALPDSQSDTSSSDADFVYVDGLENYIEQMNNMHHAVDMAN